MAGDESPPSDSSCF